MKKQITGIKACALAVVVTVLAGCQWDNLQYKEFVEGNSVTFCPPADEREPGDKKTFDYFYFGQIQKPCTSDGFNDCFQEALAFFKEKDVHLYPYNGGMSFRKLIL